jgi:hypothetical protein
LSSYCCDDSDDVVEMMTVSASASDRTEQWTVGVPTFLGSLINCSKKKKREFPQDFPEDIGTEYV